MITLYESIKDSTFVKTNADIMPTTDYIRDSSEEELAQPVTVIDSNVYLLDTDGYTKSEAWLEIDPADDGE